MTSTIDANGLVVILNGKQIDIDSFDMTVNNNYFHSENTIFASADTRLDVIPFPTYVLNITSIKKKNHKISLKRLLK